MSSELRSSYDRRQSGAAKDFKINPYKTLTKIKIPTIKLSSTGGGDGPDIQPSPPRKSLQSFKPIEVGKSSDPSGPDFEIHPLTNMLQTHLAPSLSLTPKPMMFDPVRDGEMTP